MACRQVVPERPETLVQLQVVGVEDRVHVGASEICPPLHEQIDEVPASRLQGHVERSIPLDLQPVAAAQQEECE